ncbi:tRNA (adenine(22)-N(1))-methyltransferase [Bacillus fonticola]|uniref:tRNA (adenine(22)-N(1))-methyltransferase n=1 Tax=Bacillus fonticola TaxID=2728853 RepID=UPI001885A0CD|nr:class I SAM-dependent methyltransferase [Bacillus fonticola]
MKKVLSQRLECVLSYIPIGSVLVDIGSDHAYLPTEAVKRGVVQKAIAGEVAQGPFLAAQKEVIQSGLTASIDVRKGNGLEVLEKEEGDCIVIAGMGGTLIASILENGKDKLSKNMTLILQPNIGGKSVRNWCVQNGWKCVDECVMKEDGHLYEIIVAVFSPAESHLTEKEQLFGPILLQHREDSVFREKWEREQHEWARILRQLEQANGNEAVDEKRRQLKKNIQYAKEVFS